MAQTNFTPILTYKSDTATSVPSAGNLTNSANGAELAVNTADKRLFTKDSGGNVVEVGTNPSSLTLPNSTANGVFYSNGSKVVTSGSALTFDGTKLSTSTFEATGSTASSFVTRLTNASGDFQLYASNGVSTGSSGDVKATIGLYYANTLGNLNGGIQFTRGGGGTDGWMNFFASGSEAMRLTSTGLGIGTSSPSFRLDVQAPTGVIKLTATTGTNASYFRADNTGGILYFGLDDSVASTFGTAGAYGTVIQRPASTAFNINRAGTVDMYINTTGNVGIGTSSPQAKLHVVGENAIIDRSGGDPYLAFYTSGSTTNVNIYGGSSTGFRVFTGGSERLRVDTSGNLGLGVTPSAWFTGGGYKVMQIGAGMAFDSGNDFRARIASNGFVNSSGDWRYLNTGFASNYTQTSGQHQFYTAPSGTAGNAITFTQAMTLTAGGNLGLGTTSPNSYGSTYTVFTVNNASDGAVLDLNIAGTRTATLFATSSEARLAAVTSIPLTFYTNNTERARIDSSGALLIGETSNSSASGKLSVFQTNDGLVEGARITSAGGYSALYVQATTSTFASTVVTSSTNRAANSAFNLFAAVANGVEQFRVAGNGVIYAQNTTVQSISDQRLKENIRNASEGLDVITALRPVRYDWKEGYGNDRKDQLGFIAQEMEAVFPEAVSEWQVNKEDETVYKTVGPAALIPVLVKAIQEQQAIIESLKARLDAANL